MSSTDISNILKQLDELSQPRQLPALFKPHNISPVLGSPEKKNPMSGYFVGGEGAEPDAKPVRYAIRHRETGRTLSSHQDEAAARDEMAGLGDQRQEYKLVKTSRRPNQFGLDEEDSGGQQYVVTIDAIDHGVLSPVTVTASSPAAAKQKAIASATTSMAKRGYELQVRSTGVKSAQGMEEGMNDWALKDKPQAKSIPQTSGMNSYAMKGDVHNKAYEYPPTHYDKDGKDMYGQKKPELKSQTEGVAESDEPGYVKYEQMKDKISGVLIKLYKQGKDAETIKQMGGRVAKHLGYDPTDSIYQDAWLTSFNDASLDGSLDQDSDDDYTDYSMRQGERGNPGKFREQGVAEALDKEGDYHVSVQKGKFLPSDRGGGSDENLNYLHDLMNISGTGGGPMLVTISDPRIATEVAAMYGGTVLKTRYGTYRIVQSKGQNQKTPTPEPELVGMRESGVAEGSSSPDEYERRLASIQSLRYDDPPKYAIAYRKLITDMPDEHYLYATGVQKANYSPGERGAGTGRIGRVAEEASPMITPPSDRFDSKQEAFAHAKAHGGKVFKSTYTDPNTGNKHVSFVVKKDQDVEEGSLNEERDARIKRIQELSEGLEMADLAKVPMFVVNSLRKAAFATGKEAVETKDAIKTAFNWNKSTPEQKQAAKKQLYDIAKIAAGLVIAGAAGTAGATALGVAHASTAIGAVAHTVIEHLIADIGIEAVATVLSSATGINVVKNVLHNITTSSGHEFEKHLEKQQQQQDVKQRMAVAPLAGPSGVLPGTRTAKVRPSGVLPESDVEEGWKQKLGAAALAGSMAMGASARVVPGQDEPGVNRLTGKPNVSQVVPDVPEQPILKGFSTSYLQKAADPNRFGRFLISVEDAKAEVDRRAAAYELRSQGDQKNNEQGVAEGSGDVNSKERYHFLYPHVPLDMHTDHEYNNLSDRDLQAVKSHQRELADKLGKPGAKKQGDIASHIQINRARSQYDQEQAHRRKVLDAEKIKRQARDAKRQQGVAEVAPPGARAERMVKHIKQGYAKDGKLTGKEKAIAYATTWKAHNQGQVEEASADLVGFHLDTERAYNAVMERFGDVVEQDQESGMMTVPRRYWLQLEQVAYDADGIGAIEAGGEKIAVDEVEESYWHPQIDEAIAQEDVLDKEKRHLGDYLQSVADAVKHDAALSSKDAPTHSSDTIGSAVKTVTTDDGHDLKIHGNEDDGFRISIKGRPSSVKFKSLDEAGMACEMYRSHRRHKLESADYIEEQ